MSDWDTLGWAAMAAPVVEREAASPRTAPGRVLSQAETLHARERIDRLLAELGRAILGQKSLLELVVISLLALALTAGGISPV